MITFGNFPNLTVTTQFLDYNYTYYKPVGGLQQYVINSFTPVCIPGACSSSSLQCSMQKAFPCAGAAAHTSGKCRFGIPATECCSDTLERKGCDL